VIFHPAPLLKEFMMSKNFLVEYSESFRNKILSSGKEMQIKTILRFHFTPVRMAIIKNKSNNKCWQGCGKKGPVINCWWECKSDFFHWTGDQEKKVKQRDGLHCLGGK
jgi:hypothetical protein